MMTCPSAVIEVPLTQGLVALIDEADASAVLAHKWCAHRSNHTFYAERNVRRPDGTRATLKLHQFLTGWHMVDHWNGDGLDNRRANLREATKKQNAGNRRVGRDSTSGYKGVSWEEGCRRWKAYIYLSGRMVTLGRYLTADEAARAYDERAREVHGEFAALNLPRAGERCAR